jgi:nickel-dependent lactate racemase
MRIAVHYGREQCEFEIAENKRIDDSRTIAADLSDPAGAVRTALEEPFNFPALRRALTPDDRVTVIVDENLPHLADVLIPVLEHITKAGITPENITLLSAPTSSSQPWIDELPEAFEEVHVEVHDPSDRKRLSYLATMRQGKRLYLNRAVVDADQLVVVSTRRYDPLLGRGGAEGAIYPGLSDTATIEALGSRMKPTALDAASALTRQEAVETAWLLGAPFFVQIIEGAGGSWSRVVAGSTEASEEAGRLLDARWRVPVSRLAELVIVTLTGDPAQQTFADWAAALACAVPVVEPNGRIVLLAQGRPAFGPATDLVRNTDEPEQVLKHLRREQALEMLPALQWATAASRARLYVLSELPPETVEELFATPLENAGQVQRLLENSGSYLFLEDAHRTLALIEEPAVLETQTTEREF